MKRLLCAAILSALCISTASAIEGYVIGDVELHAGPDPTYPTVAMLPDGTPVSILGCVHNWSWCDVATRVDRGWVPADFLQEEYQGQRVYVPEYGAVIGIPVVTFVFANYWDTHYRSRPFYVQRERFVSVQPQLAAPRHQPRSGSPSPTVQTPATAPTAPATTPTRPAATQPMPTQTQPTQRAPAAAAPTPPNPTTTEPSRRARSETPSPMNQSTNGPRAPESQQRLPPQQEQHPAESKAQPKSPPKHPPEGKDKDKKDKDNKDKDNKDQQS